jgi:pantoate kinase
MVWAWTRLPGGLAGFRTYGACAIIAVAAYANVAAFRACFRRIRPAKDVRDWPP